MKNKLQKLSEKAQENKNKYINTWKKENVKRICLEVSPDKFQQIKAGAQNSGESVNGYIKKAIDDRLKNDDML